MESPEAPALVLTQISKSYFGNQVLKKVDLEVAAGEIHGLVGENGAGKSTLMNILFGMPVIRETGGFDGTIRIGGRAVSPQSPSEAMDHGVGMVHQEFMLLPGFTVTENIKLNRERTRPNLASRLLEPLARVQSASLRTLDQGAMREDARRAIARTGISLDEGALVGALPVGHMQFVEIAREVDREQARLLVFDEPTAVLTENEAADLLRTMRALAAQGIAILFITHRLDEVLEVADNVTVLRDGEVVARFRRDEADAARLAEAMIGRPLGESSSRRGLAVGARGPGKAVTTSASAHLELEDLHVAMPGEEVHGVTLSVRPGEILGIGGLAGQGKIGIANGVMGIYPASGNVRLRGEPLALGRPETALRHGLAFVSEDRRGVGLLLDEAIERNISATACQVQGRFLRGRGPLALYNRTEARQHAQAMVSRLDVRCRGVDQPVRRLSGGNQQKVCLARAFTLEPELLFVSEPTRGIDVGAKQLVLDLLVEANRERGMTIVLTSSELAELRSVCDRIVIVDAGKVSGILPPDAPDVEFGLLMGGSRRG